MAKRHAAKKKQSVMQYLFLILGAGIIILVLVSWFAFPGWHAQPSGFWALTGTAALGVLAVAKDVVSILKDASEMKKGGLRSNRATIRQTQIARESEDVEQSMENTKGSQSQAAIQSKNVHQSMKK